MELNLRVINRQGQTADQELRIVLPAGGLRLGRGLANDVCLEDPERVVSGSHARIEARDGGVWVTDTSRNGTYLNDAADPIPAHQSVALYDGDRLGIGPYDVVVSFASDDAGVAEEISDPFAGGLGGPGPGESAADILDLLDPGGSGGPAGQGPDSGPPMRLEDDLYADALSLGEDLIGPAPEAPPREAPHRHTPVEHVFFQPPEQQSAPVRGPSPASGPPPGQPPDNYDLLNDAWIGVETDSEPADVSSPEADPFAQLSPQPDPFEHLAPPPMAPDGDRTDVLPQFSTPKEPSPAEVEPPQRPVAHLSQGPASSGGSTSGGELAAFLRGLGVGSAKQIQDPEIFMRLSGELLQALAAGLIQTMMGRAQFKSELRLGVTSIRAAQNNPFKFSPTPDDLLDRLLFRPSPGYLPAISAAREAFDDIQAHEMAMTAGLQAALRALFARFEPSKLEQRLSKRSGLDQLLSMARKAKYWELFNQEYEKVAADASEDFMQLFEDAFARAYQDQIQRLRDARRSGHPGPMGR